jgi:hypothetical protein
LCSSIPVSGAKINPQTIDHPPGVTRARISPHLLVLLAFAALLAAPLTAPGYFMFAHDARHTVYFMQMFDADLRDGALLPRWATDMVFGYGYPLWLILAPLPYYAAELFHLVGLDFPASIKAAEAAGWFASGLGMYLFASRLMGREAGLVAAIAYLFVPYHIVDLYVRGAMPEFLGFVFPPFILWAVYQWFTTRRSRYLAFLALAYGGMLLTHIQLTVLFSPVIAGWVLLLWLRLDSTRQLLGEASSAAHASRDSLRQGLGSVLGILWGIGVAAVFVLPVAFEQRYLTTDPLIGGIFNFRLHFVNPSQLVSPVWGYGYAGVNGSDQFSLQLGVVLLFLGVLALFVRHQDPVRPFALYFALVTVVTVLCMFSPSTPLWELAAPVVAFTQFPWRLLSVTAFSLALLAGIAVRTLAPQETWRGALVFSTLLVLAMFPFALPQYTDTQFSWNSLMDFQVKDGELLGDTVWIQQRPTTSPLVEQYRAGAITTKAAIVEGTGAVELIERRPLGDTVQVNATTPVRLMFYTRYFPGWTATIDGQAAPIAPYGAQGLIALQVAAGSHRVSTRWGITAPRVIGAALSLLSIAGTLLWLWRTRR